MTISDNTDALLLIAHGTRDPLGNAETLQLAEAIQKSAGLPVRTGFIEHAVPGVPETIDAMVKEGFRRIVAVPVILTAAGHVKNDIPLFIDSARERHSGVTFEITSHLSVHAAILDILNDRLLACEATCREATCGGATFHDTTCSDAIGHDATCRDATSESSALDAKHSPVERADTALVFLGRGSSDPDANGEIYKIARLYWEGRGFKSVHVGFIGVTFPTAQEALAQATLMRPKRIIVQPYFLFLGLLLTRIEKVVAEARALHQDMEILLTRHIGPDPRLADVVLFRFNAHRNGEEHLNCGSCQYKVRLIGREDEVGGAHAFEHAVAHATSHTEGGSDEDHTHHHDHDHKEHQHHSHDR